MICVPAYVLPYITFALGFGRLDWFIGTNETYVVLFTITTTVIFVLLSSFLIPVLIDEYFTEDIWTKEENNINDNEDDEY